MKPMPFKYYRAQSIDDAIDALGRQGDGATLLAGGQSLIPMMNLRLTSPDTVVDIGRIQDLDFIRPGNGVLSIGAVTTHNKVLSSALVTEHCPLIADAYPHVAHHTIRNRGTIGGNLCHNDPASELPLVLSLLEADMMLKSASGERVVAASEFFLGMMETAARPDELLTEIRIPCQTSGEGYAFDEVSQRQGDFSIVSAGCRFSVIDGVCKNVRFGLTGAGTQTKRIADAENALEGHSPTEETFSKAVDAALGNAEPDADIHADIAYKLDLIKALGHRVLKQALTRVTAG